MAALTSTLTSATPPWPTPLPLLLLQLKPILRRYPELLGLKKSLLLLPFPILSLSTESWCLLFWEIGLIGGVVVVVVVVLGFVGRWWWQWFSDLGLIVVVVVVVLGFGFDYRFMDLLEIGLFTGFVGLIC